MYFIILATKANWVLFCTKVDWCRLRNYWVFVSKPQHRVGLSTFFVVYFYAFKIPQSLNHRQTILYLLTYLDFPFSWWTLCRWRLKLAKNCKHRYAFVMYIFTLSFLFPSRSTHAVRRWKFKSCVEVAGSK